MKHTLFDICIIHLFKFSYFKQFLAKFSEEKKISGKSATVSIREEVVQSNTVLKVFLEMRWANNCTYHKNVTGKCRVKKVRCLLLIQIERDRQRAEKTDWVESVFVCWLNRITRKPIHLPTHLPAHKTTMRSCQLPADERNGQFCWEAFFLFCLFCKFYCFVFFSVCKDDKFLDDF